MGWDRPMTSPKASFYVIDDDRYSARLVTQFLAKAGHTTRYCCDSRQALAEIIETPPDCVLVDLMMPDLDGYDLIARLRATPELAAIKVAVLTSKPYDADRRRAAALGVDVYLTKPVARDTLLAEMEALLNDRIELRYWGVRGTLPVAGERALRYGGNTTCVTLSARRDHYFIFDAGTGLRGLADHLMAEKRRITGRILVSHPHLDHLLGLPFFAPLYVPGNEFAVRGCTPGTDGMRALIGGLMQDPYFPVTMREFGGNVFFRNLHEESFELDGAHLRTMLLRHPGNCLGYRIELRGHTVCYVTDHELVDRADSGYDELYHSRLVSFVAGASVLITDATYRDAEYVRCRGWGHSTAAAVAALAHEAGVRELHLFHHDPGQRDDDIDAKLAEAAEVLARLGSSVRVAAPAEGQAFVLEHGDAA